MKLLKVKIDDALSAGMVSVSEVSKRLEDENEISKEKIRINRRIMENMWQLIYTYNNS